MDMVSPIIHLSKISKSHSSIDRSCLSFTNTNEDEFVIKVTISKRITFKIGN
jgi:hypothetical protein